MKIVTVEQMQIIEKSADEAGLSYEKMMQNAGRGVADWVYQHFKTGCGVIGLVGSGNNGGDTLIALQHLAQLGVRTTAFLVKERGDDPLIEDYKIHGGSVVEISNNESIHLLQAALIPGVVVLDGVLGTGLKLPLRGLLLDVMVKIQYLLQNCPGALIIALDCPSGVDSDTGEASEAAIPADITLCMAAIKQGLLNHPARSIAGTFEWIDIGISDLSDHIPDKLPEMIDHDFVKSHLPPRPDNGHKGTFGTCLVVAGSAPYTGAAYLTGKGAYRSGCGLVHLGAISEVHKSLAGQLIEAVWTVLPEIDGGFDPNGIEKLKPYLLTADSLVLGPGLGLGGQNASFLHELLNIIPKTLPTLIDADGLKLLSRIDHWWTLLPTQTVLTPHPGEMSIMTGLDIHVIQAERWAVAKKFAQDWGVTLVLKGAVTVIAGPAGDLVINPTSDASLATAGSGDILSGIIGGLMAGGLGTLNAAAVGTWLHAQAGTIASLVLGNSTSVTAIDILDGLPDAFSEVSHLRKKGDC